MAQTGVTLTPIIIFGGKNDTERQCDKDFFFFKIFENVITVKKMRNF